MALQRDGILPAEDKHAKQGLAQEDPDAPYHVRKGLDLQGTCVVYMITTFDLDPYRCEFRSFRQI